MPKISRPAPTPPPSILFRSRQTRASPAVVQLALANPATGLARLASRLYLDDTRDMLRKAKFRNLGAAASSAIAALVAAGSPRGWEDWNAVRVELFHLLAPVADASWVSAGALIDAITLPHRGLLEAMVGYPVAAAGAQQAFDHAVGRGLEHAALTLLFSFPGAGVPAVDPWHVQTAAARGVEVLPLLAAAVWRGARQDHFVGAVDVAIASAFSPTRQVELLRVVNEWTLDEDDLTELTRKSTWTGTPKSLENLTAEARTYTVVSPKAWAPASPGKNAA